MPLHLVAAEQGRGTALQTPSPLGERLENFRSERFSKSAALLVMLTRSRWVVSIRMLDAKWRRVLRVFQRSLNFAQSYPTVRGQPLLIAISSTASTASGVTIVVVAICTATPTFWDALRT